MDTTYTYTYTTTSTDIDPTAALLISGPLFIVWLAILVLELVSMWKLYVKAGQPGWASIVPIYNVIVLLKIVGRPVWWIFLLLIPFVNFVIGIIVLLDFAKAYGKSAGYGVLMLFFAPIMYPVLAFSKDTKYVGPVAEETTPLAPAQPQQ